ncbi:hypothetical protein KFK14_13100 [Sphingobium phenoxybenzoativorans]|uniref:Uncharacterized protein n=1 Tax=Sphingobium phenoxybenzoativorans TaxID=1592790 RepID=A0A975K483_9SPHN|nr:hypothetical protein [Sphingobium phenoxybenzoativorans]QUT04084.1 hypothetical protein KFK14_13100 [Sphingobium phenoxybenzoativorans]
MIQLDLFAPAPTRDIVGERLIELGLVPNDYILSLNGGFHMPAGFDLPSPWNLPSRLFRSPIACSDFDGESQRRVGIKHPLLIDHPWVQEVAAMLGDMFDPDARGLNKHGYHFGTTHGHWHHAVDLMSSGHWRDLLATRQFTTDGDIVNAVAYGLDYGPYEGKGRGKSHITTAVAREILDAIEQPVPLKAEIDEALQTVSMTESFMDKKKVRHTNWHGDRLVTTWARVIGIERGWLKNDRSSFLTWTDKALTEQREMAA